MQVVILAGGLGTRLGEIGKYQPKSLIPVFGKPFLQYQIEMLKTQSVDDIVLCTGYRGDQIEEHFGDGRALGVKLKYSREPKPLGTAGALKNAESILADVFFVIYGDSYLFLKFKNILRYFLSQSKKALMTVYENHDQFDRSNTAIDGDLVARYEKTESRTQDMVYIDYGANIFKKEILDMIPPDKLYSLELLFPRLIEERELLAFKVERRFYEIGSLEGLAQFTNYVKETRK